MGDAMIPILYEASATDFSTFGIGTLTDCISCEVTEERNGAFECKLKYPTNGSLFAELKKECIIKAQPNDTSKPQAFRIYRITVPINGTVTVYAQHISYDLSNVGVTPFSLSAASPTQAIDTVLNNTVIPHNFTFQTDYSQAKDFKVEMPKSVRACLGGTEGSLMNLWGGEFEWDNFKIIHHQGRGSDNGVVIEYGKNLTKLEHDTDISDIYTDLLPYAVNSAEDGENEVVTLPEVILPINTTLATRKSAIKDFTDSFEDGDIITADMLREKAKAYIENNPLGVETPSITISFEPLWKQPEYAAILERVSLCDTVTVKHTLLGIKARTKVIKTVYDTLSEKYTAITLGSCKSNLADTVQSIESDIKSAKKEVDRFPAFMKSAIDSASKLITGQTGGYVVLHGGESGEPYELLILDAPNIDDAVNVWRWNVGGLGFSKNGYNGPYETAITADGSIVADFITTGSLVANIIKAGVLSSLDGSSYWNLETGEVVIKAYATTETVEKVELAANKAQSTADRAQTTANLAQNAVEDLAADVGDLDYDVGVLSGNVGTLTSSVRTLTTKQATLESNIDGLTNTVSSVTTRLTTAEGKLVSVTSEISTLKQTTTEISAEVSKKVDETYGTSSSSFGWVLKSTGFYVYSNASTVMSITSSGLSVVGAIDATSGSIGNLTIDGYLYFGGNNSYYISANYNDSNYYISLPGLRIDKASTAVFSGRLSAPSGTIGGFTISTNKIYKSKTTYSDANEGVYLGTDGIGLGAGTFYVTAAGKLYATNAEISGTITATSGTIGGFTINSSSLTNSGGGSSIQITSGNYTTYLGANNVYSVYSTSAGSRGWQLSHSAIQISAYTNSVYTGIKIQPNYTKRSSYTSATGTTVAEGCITTYNVASYNADSGYTTGTSTPFIIGIPRGYADAPYVPTFEWGSYLRFYDYKIAELVYDSYYGSTWRLRNAYNGKTYDLAGHKFYFWTYYSSVANDSRVSITSSTHGLSSVSGAIVIPREKSTPGSSGSLSGDKNLINGISRYGVYISGTTVYIICDTSSLSNGFYCLIYGS